MRIRYHSIDYLSLFVESDSYMYEYAGVPEWYARKVRGFIKKGFEGKAWQLLRKFTLSRRSRI